MLGWMNERLSRPQINCLYETDFIKRSKAQLEDSLLQQAQHIELEQIY